MYAAFLTATTHLLSMQGKYEEAQRLYERLLAIREKVLGPDHPEIAARLNSLTGLLKNQVSVDPTEL